MSDEKQDPFEALKTAGKYLLTTAAIFVVVFVFNFLIEAFELPGPVEYVVGLLGSLLGIAGILLGLYTGILMILTFLGYVAVYWKFALVTFFVVFPASMLILFTYFHDFMYGEYRLYIPAGLVIGLVILFFLMVFVSEMMKRRRTK